ncbi:hypothetical protein [Streptomyces sp. GMR22]|uniref:hypothetical protein n=1 Tax=Streptomyces sp. GMR22 TaxID=2759524 RepID=UPI0015FAB9EB|nr:hypothetical protein [Streptomyces sp. GMR22]MBA6441705.1 hypothetical protein [Streptomyces sp. GMR22]
MGSMLDFGAPGEPPRLRVYITGDTLMFPGIHEIARRYPEVHLAVVHLGGTRLPGGPLPLRRACDRERARRAPGAVTATRGGLAP